MRRIAFISTALAILATACGGSSGGNTQAPPPPPPRIESFNATPPSIGPGGSATLSYTFQGGTGVIDHGIGAVVSGGSVKVTPEATTAYLLTVGSAAGSATSVATVTVTPPPPPVITVSLKPETAFLPTGGTQAFSATVTGSASTAVAWSVVEPGGGSITSAGLYTAPGSPGIYHVQATSAVDPLSSARASVTVTAPPPPVVAVTVSPATVSLQAGQQQPFSATVTGSADTRVTWSVVESGGGSVTSAGLYTAPGTAGTYHVRATSTADATRYSQATVTVTALPPPLFSIQAWAGPNGSILPSGLVTVPGGGDQTFTFAPASGWHVLDVLVDGISAGAVMSYTFRNVTANHAISVTFTQDGPPPLKTVMVTASAFLPQPGAVPAIVTAVTHNLHSDPNAINAAAGRAALLELDEDYLMVASHDYSGLGAPNRATGVWDFRALDGMIDLLTGPGLKGTLAFNPIRCPAYMAMGGVPGHRPANNAQFGAYCERLVRYYNTDAGFTDGSTTYKRTPVHIKYWELWGEANINEFYDDNQEPESFGSMTPAQRDNYLSTPALYRAMYDAAAGPMKAADPTILVGGPGITGVVDPSLNAMAYIKELLLTTQPLDFVGYHDYGNFERATSDQDAFLDASIQLLPFAQQVQAAIAASTHPNARIFISEGNGNGSAFVAPIDHRANNIFDVPYLASLLRGYVLLGVDAYERFEVMEPAGSNVYSAVDSTGARSPAFYGWKLLNQQLTRNAPIRQSQVTDPAPVSGQSTVDSLAFQPSANTLTVLLINKTVQNSSDNSAQSPGIVGANVTANVTITGRAVASATLARVDSLSPLGIDTQPVAVSGGTSLSVPLRGYGITVLVMNLK